MSLDLGLTERVRVGKGLAALDHLAQQIATVEAELHRLSTGAGWEEQVSYLVQLPGIGLVTALILLSAIGDVTRFGTLPSIWSAMRDWARGPLRWQNASDRADHQEGPARTPLGAGRAGAGGFSRTHPYWRAEFQRLARRIGEKKRGCGTPHRLRWW